MKRTDFSVNMLKAMVAPEIICFIEAHLHPTLNLPDLEHGYSAAAIKIV
jgi:hypothetical protein